MPPRRYHAAVRTRVAAVRPRLVGREFALVVRAGAANARVACLALRPPPPQLDVSTRPFVTLVSLEEPRGAEAGETPREDTADASVAEAVAPPLASVVEAVPPPPHVPPAVYGAVRSNRRPPPGFE